MLYNIHAGEWDDELLRLMNVPRDVLPEVRSSSEVYGDTDAKLFGRSDPHCRHGGRPAGGSLWTDLLLPRPGEKHLRHRLLHADERRH